MKNVFKTLTRLIIVAGIFYSCTKDGMNDLPNQTNKLNIEFKRTSASSVSKLKNWLSKNELDKSLIKADPKAENVTVDFDFENPISYISNGAETVIINQKTSNLNNEINYAISFIDNSDGFNQFMIIKTVEESDTVKKLEYYSFNNNLLFITIFNSVNQTIVTYRPSETESKHDLYNKNGYDCDASWGENTAACMEDVYSNHGWISVWAAIQSAFIPQTGVALAAACAIDAYNPYDGDGCYSDAPQQ